MSAPDPTASMSPEELIAVVTRGLDADEQTARAASTASATPWYLTSEQDDFDGDVLISYTVLRDADGLELSSDRADFGEEELRHIARHDPSRVLADVESKRAQMAELESLPHYAWEGRGEYAEQVCTCGRDAHVARILRALARPYLDQESPPAMGADAGDESPCGYVRETWDGPYRMRDRCTAAAGHRGGHGPWEMTS